MPDWKRIPAPSFQSSSKNRTQNLEQKLLKDKVCRPVFNGIFEIVSTPYNIREVYFCCSYRVNLLPFHSENLKSFIIEFIFLLVCGKSNLRKWIFRKKYELFQLRVIDKKRSFPWHEEKSTGTSWALDPRISYREDLTVICDPLGIFFLSFSRR